MLKLSRYLIANRERDSVLCFSTRSAEYFTLSPDIWDALHSESLTTLPVQLKDLLVALKVLVPIEEDELRSIINESRKASAQSSVFHMIVIPSASCPLGCNLKEFGGYCGQEHEPGEMTDADQDGLVGTVAASLRPEHEKISISWFGAEPLTRLRVIRSLTRRLRTIADSTGRCYHADLTSGGTLLTKAVADECFHELGISAFSVSLDGPREVHDRRRCTKAGRPTFDIIVANLRRIIADPALSGCKLAVRCNVDKRNASAIPALVEFVAEEGWQHRVDFYFAPVHPWGDADNSAVRFEPAEYAALEIQWVARLIDLGFQPFLLPNKKPVVCRAVTSSNAVIGHDGAVHKCTESPLTAVNRPHDIIGFVGDHDLFTIDKAWKWHDELEKGSYPCTTCDLLPVCGGGCPLAWQRGGHPCPSFKYSLIERLRLQSRLGQNVNHAFQTICRKTRNSNSSQFDPVQILLARYRESGLATEELQIYDNFLWSARQKARDTKLELARYQFRASEVLRTDIVGRNPQWVHIFSAASNATLAYLSFRSNQYDAAIGQLIEAIQSLEAAHRKDAGLVVLPAQIQALVNIARIAVVHSGSESPPVQKVEAFLFHAHPYDTGTFWLEPPPIGDQAEGPLTEPLAALRLSFRSLVSRATNVIHSDRHDYVGARRIHLRVLGAT